MNARSVAAFIGSRALVLQSLLVLAALGAIPTSAGAVPIPTGPATSQCVQHLLDGRCNPNTWLFWDGVHPTTATHAILGAEFRVAVPEPAALLLLGIALAGLGWSRRKSA